jgi:hypothetical protein
MTSAQDDIEHPFGEINIERPLPIESRVSPFRNVLAVELAPYLAAYPLDRYAVVEKQYNTRIEPALSRTSLMWCSSTMGRTATGWRHWPPRS